jgi:hypothetical protein
MTDSPNTPVDSEVGVMMHGLPLAIGTISALLLLYLFSANFLHGAKSWIGL